MTTTLYRAGVKVNFTVISDWVRAEGEAEAATKVANQVLAEVKRLLAPLGAGVVIRATPGACVRAEVHDTVRKDVRVRRRVGP